MEKGDMLQRLSLSGENILTERWITEKCCGTHKPPLRAESSRCLPLQTGYSGSALSASPPRMRNTAQQITFVIQSLSVSTSWEPTSWDKQEGVLQEAQYGPLYCTLDRQVIWQIAAGVQGSLQYLCDTLQGQLFHQIDDVRPGQELLLELLHGHRECC